MDDPLNTPEVPPFEHGQESDNTPNGPAGNTQAGSITHGQIAESYSAGEPTWGKTIPNFPLENSAAGRRAFRHNLFLLLGLSLAAFTLTAWILVRVDAPFGLFSSGPQEIVRAQLRALDRGDLRPAYEMFSARYRGQVSFDDWHRLIVSHWRMFHAEVLRSGSPMQAGPGVTLEIYLQGADDIDYRARFTLVRAGGRWWIDDVHWTEEGRESDFTRI